MKITDRIKHAWNVFKNDEPIGYSSYMDMSSGPNYKLTNRYTDISIAKTIFDRIASDVSLINFRHIKINNETEDEYPMKTELNKCLSLEANIDQSYIQFFHDLVYSMFEEGVVAVVPVDTTINPKNSNAFDVLTMRVGKIINWYPEYVKVSLYNEKNGRKEDVIVKKSVCAIIENPFYTTMNTNNATLKRLIKALNLSDIIDQNVAQNKFNMILQLPYIAKTDIKKEQAASRIKDIENQLVNNKYGIAYVDGTEKITQLSRPIDTSINEKVKILTTELYNQLGLTPKIFDGTAGQQELINYNSRTIELIAKVISIEFTRKFLSKTARTQGQTISFNKDPFKLVPVTEISNLADTFTRNAILTPNEIRKIVGFRPHNDPSADLLGNRNIADVNQIPNEQGYEQEQEVPEENEYPEDYYE